MNKIIYFDGISFCKDERTNYYLSSKRIDGKRKRLHVYIWEKENGALPAGFCIHHKDMDKANNTISNLVLMSKVEHRRMHQIINVQNDEYKHNMIKHLDSIRDMTKEWHASKEGREWHAQHYEKNKTRIHVKKEFTCQCCGKKYIAVYNGHNKFCSNNCKSMQRRRDGRKNKIDNDGRRRRRLQS